MVKVFFVVFLFALMSATGIAGQKAVSLELHGQKMDFIHDSALHIVVTKQCQVGVGAFDCQAYHALKSASLNKVKSKQGMGRNPGALICLTTPSAHVSVALDSEGDEISVCVFPDSSAIETGSLLYYGIKNDKHPH